MTILTCPVCQGQMREVNKEGVLVDTCTQCRGVWLDRGELEKLIGLVEPPPNARGMSRNDYRRLDRDDDDDNRRSRRGLGLGGFGGGDDYDDDDDDDDRRRNRGSAPQQRRRSSWLTDFFD